MQPIIIVGAGAAGLAAANEIAARGVPVMVLEARKRAGGRILTHHPAGPESIPLELGAEFIHGRDPAVWDIIRAAGLKTHEVPDRHWQWTDGKLSENPKFWDDLEKAFGSIDCSQPDQSVLEWLQQNSHLENHILQMALEYVEGFHAAPAERMSVCAVGRSNSAAEEHEGQQAFRIENGYDRLIQWMLHRLALRGVPVHLNTVAKTIRWQSGAVEVEAFTPDGFRTFEGARALITVPLGVLKTRGEGGIIFEPALLDKERAIDGLEMGHVVKVTFQFRSPFWPEPNFGFLHTNDEWLPTWWADPRGAVLSGWAGGLRAEWLGNEGDDAVIAEGLRALSQIFKVEREQIRDLLVRGVRHDWTNDPFSRGAYSYTPAGMIDCPGALGAPVDHALYFAGEATDTNGEQGTVHAALASGKRAAKEILESLRAHRIASPIFGR